MSIAIFLIQFAIAGVLLLAGIGLNKGYRSSKLEVELTGDKYFAKGYKQRQFVLLFVSILLIVISIVLFYNAFTRNVF